ncbi:Putative pterin-4-alpha-carbinolamine dehydratase [Aquisphaera giovannonii]|uniref:Putative pterin-4-alpha-carbinolamine dehydratase n=1 Tax=Aquisphaera giovannonii TaxID=406548 RepID=A0A5B9WCW6_9BACT|nr:4a-hydroxytetrahydrobiopterin dehydratase [Aquisphaera giovannonii]QEH37905.1 Putative pterin-4-alpha-carbinolamine dehydratase [Aquisphaera giovannonii]
MSAASEQDLNRRSCVPCEGGVPPVAPDEAREQVRRLPGWSITADGRGIRREWTVKNFMAGIEFFDRLARLAEEEGHHPDLHLEGYRKVAVVLTTHAIGGLSENDFILAAKINQLPIASKS